MCMQFFGAGASNTQKIRTIHHVSRQKDGTLRTSYEDRWSFLLNGQLTVYNKTRWSDDADCRNVSRQNSCTSALNNRKHTKKFRGWLFYNKVKYCTSHNICIITAEPHKQYKHTFCSISKSLLLFVLVYVELTAIRNCRGEKLKNADAKNSFLLPSNSWPFAKCGRPLPPGSP